MVRIRRRHRRGFTLVEILVALTAGLIVSAAAYILARNAMKSFQEESRISTGQVSAALGLNRMMGDLQRAGYMASPNADRDPRICKDLAPGDMPVVGVQIAVDGSGNDDALPEDPFGYGVYNTDITMPDAIVVMGNMTSSEQFEYRVVDGTTVVLAMDRGPTQRAAEDVGHSQAAFEAIFLPQVVRPDGTTADGERFARIVEATGREHYVVVTAIATQVASGKITEATLTIENADGTTPTNISADCGFVNRGPGLINPISIIRYRVGRICDPYDYGSCSAHPYGPAVLAVNATGNTLPGHEQSITAEQTRSELLREELAPSAAQNNQLFDNTLTTLAGGGLISQEVAAEFAVQLDISATWVQGLLPPPAAIDDGQVPFMPLQAPELTFTAHDDDAIDYLAGDVQPQRFRSLRVRLGTRARTPDRDAGNPTAAITRYELGPLAEASPPVVERFARMRTLQSEITLPNLQQVSW